MFTIKQKSGKIKSKRNYLRTEYKVPCFIVYNKIKIKYILAYIYMTKKEKTRASYSVKR